MNDAEQVKQLRVELVATQQNRAELAGCYAGALCKTEDRDAEIRRLVDGFGKIGDILIELALGERLCDTKREPPEAKND